MRQVASRHLRHQTPLSGISLSSFLALLTHTDSYRLLTLSSHFIDDNVVGRISGMVILYIRYYIMYYRSDLEPDHLIPFKVCCI